MKTRELIESYPFISDEERAGLLGAISTRGKWKGYLLARAPSASTRPNDLAAWEAMVGFLAPARISIFSMMFDPDPEAQAAHTRFDTALKGDLGKLLNITEPPMRWNLYAYHHDVEKMNAALVSLKNKNWK